MLVGCHLWPSVHETVPPLLLEEGIKGWWCYPMHSLFTHQYSSSIIPTADYLLNRLDGLLFPTSSHSIHRTMQPISIIVGFKMFAE